MNEFIRHVSDPVLSWMSLSDEQGRQPCLVAEQIDNLPSLQSFDVGEFGEGNKV